MALPRPPVHPRRIAFLGTPEMAVAPLEALHAAGFDIALVVTGPDKRRGRGSSSSPTPVKLSALALGIPVSHDPADAAAVGADTGVVVAYGRLLRRPLLEVLPMVNLHFSLLPRWRGAAPVERALLAGDERTGVCVMGVEEALDTGDVYAQADIAIRRTSTVAELREQLTQIGSELLVSTLRAGLSDPRPQRGDTTYADKLTVEDLHLHWEQPVEQLDRVVRVGGAWTTFRGRRLKVHEAEPVDANDLPSALVGAGPGCVDGAVVACGSGALRLRTVQPEGKGRVDAGAWANGARLAPGERLGDDPSDAAS